MRRLASQVAGTAARGIADDIGQLREDLLHLATRDIVKAGGPRTMSDNPNGGLSDWAATSVSVQVSDGP